MTRRKAVIFDLYGTLIDIQTDEQDPWLYGVLSQYLSYYMVRIQPEELRKAYVEEVRISLGQSLQKYPEVNVYNIFRSIMDRYGRGNYGKPAISAIAMLFRSLSRKRFGAFPGAHDAISRLSRRYRVAAVSDAQWVFTDTEMEMLGFTRFFKTRVLSSRLGYKKPDPRLFEMALKSLQVRPEDAVYVGDNPEKDLRGARAAGMKCVLFRGGNEPSVSYRPDGRFNDYSDLERLVDAILT